jgi:hypothetical protein
MRAALILVVAAAILPAWARADAESACAKIEEPLAYNACLAARGPRARDVAVSPEPAGDDYRSGRVGKAPALAARPGLRFPAVARRHGRIHMEFRIR